MAGVVKPLLPWPHLSTSARSLSAEEVAFQYALARDAYMLLLSEKPTKWRGAEMWRGYEGALLYWWGELAAQMPAGVVAQPVYLAAWSAAYAGGRMAVGPLPWWLGDTHFHLACQSQLIAQDPTRYARQFVHAPLDVAYLWPLKKGEWQWSS